MSFVSFLLIGLHALFAWLLIEIFVNVCHSLSRVRYVALHYLVIVGSFAVLFGLHERFFDTGASPFETTIVAIGFVLVLEFVVFRYVYAGERWFLNFVDWIFPMFLAASTVYAVTYLW